MYCTCQHETLIKFLDARRKNIGSSGAPSERRISLDLLELSDRKYPFFKISKKIYYIKK